MELTMNLPRNYVEIEEEEMMYLDGGTSSAILRRNLNGLYNKARTYIAKVASWSTAGRVLKSVGLTPAFIAKVTGSVYPFIGRIVGMISGVVRWLGPQAVGLGLICGTVFAMSMACFRIFY